MSLIPALSRSVPDLSQVAGRAALQLRKHAPHILFVGGVSGVITSTVMACKATLKLSDTLGVIEEDLEAAKKLREVADTDEAKRDIAYVYIKSTMTLARLYGPSIAVGAVSIGALTGSHVTLARRNTALMAAYSALHETYERYKERVEQEVGPEKAKEVQYADIPEDDSDLPCLVDDPNQYSMYARFFDEGAENFQKDPELNRIWITVQQNWANEMLRARGHLFLNEVYDMLGLERSQAGSVVGWVIGPDGDNYVNFGMFQPKSAQFINNREPRIILDFNVDGVIYDKI